MKYILTDIEGTTSSISFVHEVLFPYATIKLRSFVHKSHENAEVKKNLNDTVDTAKKESGKNLTEDEAIDLLLYWIKTDRKHPALKNLQGLIWEEGYLSGEIKGHVYDDVSHAFSLWKEKGLSLGVYSSGSVKAQHLLFEHSIAGNLRGFFKHHFDTCIGHKRETNSYLNIIKELNIPASEILFLSDIKEELDAAREAGMKTTQLIRLNNVIRGDHPVAQNFLDIPV